MAYQSKTYSLSDEVVAVIDAARAKGESPNKFLRRVLGLDGATIHVELPPHQSDDRTNLDAVGPRLSDGRGKATTETRKGKNK